MMLPNKTSADMGTIVDYLNKQPTAKLEIEHNAHLKPRWSAHLYNPIDFTSKSFNVLGESFDEALAKLSKLVYEEQLKTKG